MSPARTKLRIKAWHEYHRAAPGWEWREKIEIGEGKTIAVDLVPDRLQRVPMGFQGSMKI